AGQAERHWPDRRAPRPVEDLLGRGHEDPPARHVMDGVGEGGQSIRRLVALGSDLVVLLPLLEILDITPDRSRHLGYGTLYFHSNTPPRSAYTQPSPTMPTNRAITQNGVNPIDRSTSAQGKRKTARVSKTMNSSATR